MITKQDFNKVWKDTSKEGVLNQFYYEHYELIKYKEVIDKLKEYMNTLCDEYADDNYDIKCEVFNKIYYEILGDSNE